MISLEEKIKATLNSEEFRGWTANELFAKIANEDWEHRPHFASTVDAIAQDLEKKGILFSVTADLFGSKTRIYFPKGGIS